MALTVSVIRDIPSSGGRYVTFEFDAGTAQYHREYFLQVGEDALAFGNAQAPLVEAEEKRKELEIALVSTYERKDPHTLTYHIATTEEMRTHVVRSVSNASRELEEKHIEELLNSRVFLGLFTNAQLLSYLEGSNIGQVNGWVNWLDGLATQIETHVHGIPEQVV